jgi:hypothetical protein
MGLVTIEASVSVEGGFHSSLVSEEVAGSPNREVLEEAADFLNNQDLVVEAGTTGVVSLEEESIVLAAVCLEEAVVVAMAEEVIVATDYTSCIISYIIRTSLISNQLLIKPYQTLGLTHWHYLAFHLYLIIISNLFI